MERYYERNDQEAVTSQLNNNSNQQSPSIPIVGNSNLGFSIFSIGNGALPKFTDAYNTSLFEIAGPKNQGEQLQKNLLYGDPNKGIIGRSIDSMFNVPMKNLKDYYSNLENTNFSFSNTQDVINGFNSMPKATVYNSTDLKRDPIYGKLVPQTVKNTNDKIINNFNTAVSNMNKQNNLNALTQIHALGGSLDYDLQNQYAINSYMNTMNKSKITAMPNSFQRPQLDSMNYFAMGGMPDFNEFNTGGTHEQNPNGGIPQGIDNQGIINTVEQGETKTTTPEGDYIFSDRLKLSKEECKQLGVPKDSTYAEASKLLRKEYDEMPNDEIARKGWEQSRDMLIQSQEMQKQEIALKEARKQGLNSPKMQGINSQVMQDMYYNENPQEETLLQQGINPNIQNAFGGLVKKFYMGGPPLFNTKQDFLDYVYYQNVQNNNKNAEDTGNIEITTKPLISLENLKYAPIAANIAGLAQNLFTPEDYSIPNRLQKEINALPRVSVPKNTNYMTYNPVDVNRYTNQYNANAAAQRNAIMNTSSPSRQSAMVAQLYNSNIGYGDLVQAIEAQNAKEKQAVQQFNAGIDQQNIANQLQADNINQNYEQMRINGIMQELAMRDAIQTARANAISSNLDSLTSNLAGIGTEAYNLKSLKTALQNNYDFTATPEQLTNWNEQEVRNYYKQRGNDDVSINNLIKQWKQAKGE